MFDHNLYGEPTILPLLGVIFITVFGLTSILSIKDKSPELIFLFCFVGLPAIPYLADAYNYNESKKRPATGEDMALVWEQPAQERYRSQHALDINNDGTIQRWEAHTFVSNNHVSSDTAIKMTNKD